MITKLCTKDLIVSESLQRGMRKAIIAKIVKDYNPKSIGIILVSHRDGKYYIIDGQHRVYALSKLGIVDVECRILTGLSEIEEATIYKQLATSSLHSKFEKFKADLIINNNDDNSVEIKTLIESLGFEIDERKGQGKIACLNEIYKCYKEDKDLLRITINLLKESFELSKGLTGVELRGLFIFLKKAIDNDKFNLEFFKNRLAGKTQSYFLRMGSTNKEASYTTPAKGYALAMLSTYNHNKAECNRIALDLLS